MPIELLPRPKREVAAHSIPTLIAEALAANFTRKALADIPPDLELPSVIHEGPVNAKKVAAYSRLTGDKTNNDALPVNYYYIHAMASLITLMAQKNFPLRIFNVLFNQNRTHVFQPVSTEALMRVRCSLRGIEQRDKGVDLHFDTSFTAPRMGEIAKMRSIFTYNNRPRTKTAYPPVALGKDWDHVKDVALPAHAGRRFAQISGDCNPAHLSPAMAKLFAGRSGMTLQGACSNAFIMAGLKGRGSPVVDEGVGIMESRYIASVQIPGSENLMVQRRSDGLNYGLYDQRRQCFTVQGTLSRR